MRRTWSVPAVAILMLASAGCFNPFRPDISNETVVATPAPIPNTPLNLLALFKWCWENRDPIKYREVFSADYVFDFSAADSSGRPYRDNPWRREDELIFAHNLFIAGSAAEAPASTITLSFPSLHVDRDQRPGKTYPWHQAVYANTNLNIQKTDGTGLQVNGEVTFYVVRGDSAEIPTDLGFSPDAHRWYIERQVDQSGGSSIVEQVLHPAYPGALHVRTWTAANRPAPLAANGAATPVQIFSDPTPTISMTWGQLRASYH